MKIVILTCFKSLSPTSSLVHVVASHIDMLLTHHYQVHLILCEGYHIEEAPAIYHDPRLTIGELPLSDGDEPFSLLDYYDPLQPIPPHFNHWLATIKSFLVENLKDCQLCMLHDIHYQPTASLYHLGLQQALPYYPQLPLIAFTHSYPYFRPSILSPEALPHFTPLPHTYYVYPTQSGLCALSEQYGIPEALCRCVYHPCLFLSTPQVQALSQQIDLFSPDLLVIYPARLTPAKKQDKIISLLGALKLASQLSVTLIFCDTLSDTPEALSYKQSLYETAHHYGLTSKEVFFTSDLGYIHGLSHESILELFHLSNLFILPSLSESFSLILLEAATKGNFIVYNENVPALSELGSLLHGYPMHWEAREDHYTISPTYQPSEASYYGYHACLILKAMLGCSPLWAKTQIRKRFNTAWIWHHQLEPLLKEVL